MDSRFALNSVAIAVAIALTSNTLYAESTTSQNLDTIIIEGDVEQSAVGPDFSYVGEVSRTATKTNTPLVKTPQAVSVVTREQMDDRGVISIADALKYTPSIQANYFGEDNKQDWFIIRGFKQANNGLYQDGTRLYSSGFYSWQIDPYALERVEIARGPTSTLNGQMPPGGIVNVISKRAQLEEDTGEVSVKVGSYDRQEVNFDVNQTLSDDVAVRVVGLIRENGTQVDGLQAERTMIAPSVTWKINENNKLTVLASYQEDDSDPYLQFLPIGGTLNSNPNGSISDSTALGNTDWETFEREQTSLGYEFEHAFSEKLYFIQSARFSHLDINLRQMYSSGYVADNDTIVQAPSFTLAQVLDPTNSYSTILRAASTDQGSSDAINLDNRLVYDFNFGTSKHKLLTGLDYQSLSISSNDYANDPIVTDGDVISALGIANPAFDIYNVSYTDNVVLLNSSTFATLTDSDLQNTKTENEQLGFYLQDQIAVNDKLSVHAGLRYDDTETTTHNTSTDAKTKVTNGEWTSSLGTSYDMGNGIHPYARYAESFNPILNEEASKPERSSLYEVGTKFQPSSFDGYFSIAAYHLTKENLAQGSGSTFTQIGEVVNTGIEFETVANLSESLTIIANLSIVNSEIEDDTDSSIVGNTPEQVAENLASLWANYKFFGGSLNNLTLGAGLRHVGESYSGNSNDYTVPSFTLLDATASYRWKDYKFQVTAKNLLDKEYVATCTSDYFCYYGDRRNIIASMTYDW